MLMKAAILALALIATGFVLSAKEEAPLAGTTPEYTPAGEMKKPKGYREWVYLSSGFDMSYNPATQVPGRHTFDNVFVNPEAYRAFVQTGTWPDKTVLVLEVRTAEGKGSINQQGSFQATDVAALEVHVKDEARFPGKWAFFGFDTKEKTAKMIPKATDCYSCHEAHGAVDTTFVQFYPTLMPVARAKGTLSAPYIKESTADRK